MPARCWFDRYAHHELIAEARRWKLRETGGALLGWRDGDQSVVCRVLGPGPHAVHRRHSFEPDAAWQNEQGARIYRDSDNTIAFLGDWHTHPFGAPVPSRQDRETGILLAEDVCFRTPIPLYAILGRSTWPATRRRPRELAIYELHDRAFARVDIELADVDLRRDWR